MFRYDNSNKVSEPREKPAKHISEIRKVTYVNLNPKTKERIVTEGWEIAREIIADPAVPLSMTADIVGTKMVENLKVQKPKRKQELTEKPEQKPD